MSASLYFYFLLLMIKNGGVAQPLTPSSVIKIKNIYYVCIFNFYFFLMDNTLTCPLI